MTHPPIHHPRDHPVPAPLAEAMERAGLPTEPHWSGDVALCEAALRIAVIGTRKPTPVGLAATEAIAGQLAVAGAVIVSGAALGTDMAGHRAALDRGRPTIAVLPCGIGCIPWPDWRRPFATVGPGPLLLMLSPFDPRQVVTRQTPVIRNRLVAALAHAVVVGEAGLASGTHYCVAHAMTLRVPVFFLRTGREEPALATFQAGLERRGARAYSPDDAWGPAMTGEVLRAAAAHQAEVQRTDLAQLRLFPEGNMP